MLVGVKVHVSGVTVKPMIVNNKCSYERYLNRENHERKPPMHHGSPMLKTESWDIIGTGYTFPEPPVKGLILVFSGWKRDFHNPLK